LGKVEKFGFLVKLSGGNLERKENNKPQMSQNYGLLKVVQEYQQNRNILAFGLKIFQDFQERH
jgi:hypothetical protein